jgi:hypothetical protein
VQWFDARSFRGRRTLAVVARPSRDDASDDKLLYLRLSER